MALIAASLTRLQGVLLIIPLFLYLLEGNKPTKVMLKPLLYAPLIGLGIYMAHLYITTGDPLYFLHVQSDFGAQRTSSIVILPQVIYRYIKIFFTASFNFQYFVALVEFAIFHLCFLLSLYHAYISYKKKEC